jgi:hypothetical protein
LTEDLGKWMEKKEEVEQPAIHEALPVGGASPE